MIDQGQRSFRSQISYVDLVGVLIASALMIVLFNSKLGAVVVIVIGVVWVGFVVRSVIVVTAEGVTLRGLWSTRRLTWAETVEFVVNEPFPMISVVAAAGNDGKLHRVHGTLATPLDPTFPSEAVAELNRVLQQHNAAAVIGEAAELSDAELTGDAVELGAAAAIA